MNIRALQPVLLALALAATPAAFAAEPGDPPAEDYHFGSRPDIAEVLRPADLDFCGIREVEMLYLDHQGQKHRLRYPVWGSCPSQN
ncbi:Protein of unknown function [Pseudomonas citronellolis]|uniref:DUF2790 domain-containing protein n=1 Tax=Pseudomonas citronellolis TaxID=53408 RepID=A0AAQ1HQL4_9PSED|nr:MULTISPECIES: DUF2790 domain-containing protein [Pseudomonas]MCL6693255.1 DUF2790 domain-containing protein [Pseudomonas sp. R3.Fl]MCP1604921.1 hypothetical protein [Pseudomonas citronellolis]MCP1645462.1 hypothetical protein [Pseudomonas citronellolis]MCP1655840.1 hypothetical protein [Pseudomonas citronellolis]MCP1668303.1 hypothetical protein [Pseudomonas citronellolis]